MSCRAELRRCVTFIEHWHPDHGDYDATYQYRWYGGQGINVHLQWPEEAGGDNEEVDYFEMGLPLWHLTIEGQLKHVEAACQSHLDRVRGGDSE